MNITEPFVLKSDVLLIPCAELSDDVRGRLPYEEGDFTLSRRHGRAMAQVIDSETAALLELFREPRTIVDAVLQNSRSFSRDPEVLLDELLPHLGRFLDSRVLVPAGSEDEHELRPRFESGATIAGWKIVRCASLIEDSEVYQLRNGGDVAALKIARLTTPEWREVFENETAILRHLDGNGIAPRLLDAGVHEERPYIVMEWLDGVNAGVAAARRRHDRPALLELCASIAAAYAKLHASGVLHVDVHPRNVLVGETPLLLDFGYSRFIDRPPRVGRGGLNLFYEPELFAGRRQGIATPPSPAGEQYALAALLYLVITGQYYLDFRFEREEMARQIETEAPVPLAKRGVAPWPDVEEILFRALEKDPSQRHPSMAGMAALLSGARDAAVRESLSAPVTAEAHAFLEDTLRSFARGGAMFAARYPTPPTASINYGSAGAAVGLLRIAETRGDPALLALADVWRSRAAVLIGTEGACHAPEHGLPREALGDVTPYHTETGIHAAAMVAAALGDTSSRQRATSAFIAASSRQCSNLDLTLGRSGSLLAAAMLLSLGDDASLRAFGNSTMQAIWHELDTHPPLERSPDNTYLGLAHGWAGFLYAALRWSAASGEPLPPRLVERLHQYATLKIDKGRGACWPVTTGADSLMPGWCNGTAGQVFLFTLAHRLLGDDQWLQLAELSAWNNWDEPRAATTLCCGTVGRAYALLNLYKHTGAPAWLSRARQLANHAAANASSTAERTNSLWKGELGVAVLIADLGSPENARMPFFE